jgi:hypothetical protein
MVAAPVGVRRSRDDNSTARAAPAVRWRTRHAHSEHDAAQHQDASADAERPADVAARDERQLDADANPSHGHGSLDRQRKPPGELG